MAICNKCGSQVEDGSTFCPNCGSQMMDNAQFQNGPDLSKQQTPPPPPPPQYNNQYNPNAQYNAYNQQQPAQPPVSMTGMLVWAILNTLFCCLPFGIVAIVMSAKINSAMSYEEARMAYDSAKKWNLVATIVGAAVVILYFILVFVGVFSFANIVGSYDYYY
ncbi:CD225/dispanin family protein [Candidatus Soleaferrea massiliensis]|uniref:CD225/dispanin family protein n=1 Tax=Candidatus Soleaferrea massiliensis TaxID=1470354 RepID=UPI0006943B9A|nr:CD225/dispanin family protein [Candidatus Soleaferrea massiliensis]